MNQTSKAVTANGTLLNMFSSGLNRTPLRVIPEPQAMNSAARAVYRNFEPDTTEDLNLRAATSILSSFMNDPS